jgi:hypothetical protein
MEHNIDHKYIEGVVIIYSIQRRSGESHIGFEPFVQLYCQEWPDICGGLSECPGRRLGERVGQHTNPHGIDEITRGL